MALPQFNTTVLINSIKRRCSVPTSQLTYTDLEWVELANDILIDEVVPLMMSAREEYFVTHTDVVVPSTGVIPFPSAAIGAKLRSVCIVQQSSPLILTNVPRLDLDVISGVNSQYGNGYGIGFYVEGNDLNFYPSTGGIAGKTVRLYFYNRTLALAAPTAYGKVTSVDTNTNTITVSRVVSGWTTGTVLNTVSGTPTFGTTNTECTIVSVSSPDIELDTVEGISVGDYITDQGYSAIPQIPVEAHGYLAQLTAAKSLEGLGDREGMVAAQKKAEAMLPHLMTVISQRVDGSVKKIINPNGGIKLASSIGRRGLRR